MFTSINHDFMGPLGRRGDSYYEDVHCRRNDEDAGGDACESESDSDEAVFGTSSKQKQRIVDSYGKIKKRKGNFPICTAICEGLTDLSDA